MKEFSELINRLLLTSSRNRKIDILSNYFQNTSDPDRGYTLAILTNGLELRNIPIFKIKEIVFENIDHELFTLSYDYVGDLAETISIYLSRFLHILLAVRVGFPDLLACHPLGSLWIH